MDRRHLDESQRAMVAARIATLPKGANQHGENSPSKTQSEAAALLNISRDSVKAARVVLEKGSPELVKAVDRGQRALERDALDK
jgi:hypothetical protein